MLLCLLCMLHLLSPFSYHCNVKKETLFEEQSAWLQLLASLCLVLPHLPHAAQYAGTLMIQYVNIERHCPNNKQARFGLK